MKFKICKHCGTTIVNKVRWKDSKGNIRCSFCYALEHNMFPKMVVDGRKTVVLIQTKK